MQKFLKIIRFDLWFFAACLVGIPLEASENIFGLPEPAIASKGSLFLVGGGRTTDQIRAEFVRLAGGPKARIVLIPSAATFSDMACIKEYFSPWRECAIASLAFLDAASREQANSPDFAHPLDDATGVWMPGGSQGRLTDLYGGTRVEQAIQHVLERGGVVGGTSAGAAVASQLMILEGTNCDAVVSRGFGMLTGAVVDQHFSQRGRHTRLLQVLDEHPGLLGLGVDEETALVVQGNHLRVLGESRVTLCLPTSFAHAMMVYRFQSGDDVELMLPDGPVREFQMRVSRQKADTLVK